MKKFKCKKVFTSFLLLFSSASIITSCTILNNRRTNVSNDLQSHNQRINTKLGEQSFQINFGDIVDSYTHGYIEPKVLHRIVIAQDTEQGQKNTPDENNILIDVSINGDTITVSNTKDTNPDGWNSIKYENSMQEDFDLDTPASANFIANNYFKLTEYNANTMFNAPGSLNWNKKQKDPTLIQGQVNLNTQNSILLQMGIKNVLKTKFKVFVQVEEKNGSVKWLNNADVGCSGSGSGDSANYYFEGIIMQDIADGNKVKLFIPNQDSADITNKGAIGWQVEPNAQKYQTIEDAFNAFKNNPSELAKIITFNPTLCTNSMSGFPINVVINEAKNSLQIDYGNNDTFKHVFFASRITSGGRHIFPFKFEVDNNAVIPGLTANIKGRFENYADGISVINNITTLGTYVDSKEWNIDKNRFASEVTIAELKQEIFKHIVRPAENFSVDDIVLAQNDNNSNLEYDNATGKISFNIILKKYKNEEGQPETSQNGKNFKANQEIIGFKQIQPTSVKKETIDINDNQLIASQQKPSDIKKLIIKRQDEIFSNLAKEIDPKSILTEADLDVNIVKTSNTISPENSTGFLIAAVTLKKNFLTKPNALIATGSERLEFELKVVGFKTIQSTIFNLNINLSQTHGNQLATDFGTIDKIQKMYNDNPSLFVINLPDNTPPRFSITQVSNVGDPSINGGNSGFIRVNLTFSKIYDEEGAEKYNQTKSYVIYGFKKISPTYINEYVSIKQPSQLITEILKGSEQEKINKVKQIIDQNKNAFFGESTLPENLLENLDVKIIKIKNTTSESDPWQLKIKLTLKKYYDNSGRPQTTPPLSKEVKVSGYKTVKPTSLKTDFFYVKQNSGYESRYPFELAENNFELLKEMIINRSTSLEGEMILGDLPNNPIFNTNDIVVLNEKNPQIPNSVNPIINNKDGSLKVTIFLKRWYSNPDGELMVLEGNEYAKNAPSANITIKGLNSAKATSVVSRDRIPIPNSDEYKLLKNTSAGEVANILQKVHDNKSNPEPESILSEEEKNILTHFKKFLYNEAFSGYKFPFDEKKIIIEPFPDANSRFDAENKGGLLQKINITMIGIMDQNGRVDPNTPIKAEGKIITGFYEIKQTSINTAYELHGKVFQVPPTYASYTPNYIVDNLLLPSVIQAHDYFPSTTPENKIILGDIPKEFIYVPPENSNEQSSLMIDPDSIVVDTEKSTIEFTLRITWRYSAQGEVINNPPSDPVKIKFAGFKQISSTTINGMVVTNDFIYPTATNQTKNIMEIRIQEKSSARFLTSSAFKDSIKSLSNNSEEIMKEQIDSLFYFAESNIHDEQISQPIIVYNPDPQKKLIIDAFVFGTTNDEQGYIILQLRVKGYYFDKSTEASKIENDSGAAYAYINVKLKGFKPLYLYLEQNKNSTFIIPVLASGIIFIIFLIIIILKFSLKTKRKHIPDKDMFFED